MGTEAQLKANQANAQHSTGPKSPEGKAAVSQNNFRHGLSGHFQVLPWEKQEEFDNLRARLRAEHPAYSPFEAELIEKMAQHYWVNWRRPCVAGGLLQPRRAAL